MPESSSVLALALAANLAVGRIPTFSPDQFDVLFEAVRVDLEIDGRPNREFEKELKQMTYRLSDGQFRVELTRDGCDLGVGVVLRDGRGEVVQKFYLLRGKPFITTDM